MAKVEPPLFTLRGHDVGVSALSSFIVDGETYLVSGDEEGTVIVWDLDIYREVSRHSKLLQSRIQAIKSIKLNLDNQSSNILVFQSRNNGVQCFLVDSIRTPKAQPISPLAHYPTYENLFTRADAIQLDDHTAVLAHPALLENHMITVRIVGDNLKTHVSGSASRNNPKGGSVFDVRLTSGSSENKCWLYVGYEDGHLCLFRVNRESTTASLAELGDITGLKIDLVSDFDLKVGDFLSAFDVCHSQNGNGLAVCGSPTKDLIFIAHERTEESTGAPICVNNVDLRRKGVSAVCMRPDRKLVAVSLWDCSVRLYSLRSQKLLACLKNHQGRVQCITFVERRPEMTYGNTSCKYSEAEERRRQYILCCASQEGTISLSAIY